MGKMRNAYKVLVLSPECWRIFVRPRRRWENNIKIDVTKIGWDVWATFIWLRVGTSGGIL
jgi:hypothetical protein